MHRLIRIFAGRTCSIVGNAVPTHIEMDISHKETTWELSSLHDTPSWPSQLSCQVSSKYIQEYGSYVERTTRRRGNFRKMGGRMVHPPAETFRGFVLLCLPFDSNGLVSLKARSSVGTFLTSAPIFFPPFFHEEPRHDWNIVDMAWRLNSGKKSNKEREEEAEEESRQLPFLYETHQPDLDNISAKGHKIILGTSASWKAQD